ncbi:hypothetical protein KKF61_02885 [Patescibacteria group bacterium]|nr:hypothetical protein [Patescibacteria group bacterium]
MDNKQDSNENAGPTKKKKIKPIYWVVIIVVIIIVVAALTQDNEEETNTNPTPAATTNTSVNNANTQVEPAGTLLDYDIEDEEDLSYAGCERVGVYITVPDDASQIDIDYTLEAIIDEYSGMWDDVTVWVDNTGDMDEWSICD